MVSYKTALQIVKATIADARNRGLKRIFVGVVEAKIVDGDIGLAACPQVVPLKCERSERTGFQVASKNLVQK